MSSQKQEALADLMYWLICLARGPASCGFFKRLWARKQYKRLLADLYFIHRIPISILHKEYRDNDISFINDGINHYVEELGQDLDARVAYNLILIIDDVPDERKGEVTYIPPEWLRKKAKQSYGGE